MLVDHFAFICKTHADCVKTMQYYKPTLGKFFHITLSPLLKKAEKNYTRTISNSIAIITGETISSIKSIKEGGLTDTIIKKSLNYVVDAQKNFAKKFDNTIRASKASKNVTKEEIQIRAEDASRRLYEKNLELASNKYGCDKEKLREVADEAYNKNTKRMLQLAKAEHRRMMMVQRRVKKAEADYKNLTSYWN